MGVDYVKTIGEIEEQDAETQYIPKVVAVHTILPVLPAGRYG